MEAASTWAVFIWMQDLSFMHSVANARAGQAQVPLQRGGAAHAKAHLGPRPRPAACFTAGRTAWHRFQGLAACAHCKCR